MPVGSTASCAEESRVGQLDIIHSTTWLLLALPLPVFPSTKEPIRLFRSGGKRPDGLTLVPWQSGKSCWDVTVSCPLAESYVTEAAREAGAAAELAATCKEAKYAGIVGRHMFEPIAVEITFSMRQPFGFWMILAGGSPRFLVRPERLVICISEFRCWCSVSTLFCYMTATRSLTARTEHHNLSVIFFIFKTSLENRYRGFNNNNNNNKQAHTCSTPLP